MLQVSQKLQKRVIIFIGDNLRHKYVLWRLLEAGVNLAGVVVQKRLPDPIMRTENKQTLSKEDQEILEYHFNLRDQTELTFFGYCRDILLKDQTAPVLSVSEGHINDEIVENFVRQQAPDIILVYGTRLLRDALLSICPGRTINLHLGLSPAYRGAATIFWPLYNNEPEYVGATIHQIDLTIDTGKIFHHVRPEIVPNDNPHTIGCKTVQVAVGGILRTLWELERGDAKGVTQWEKGQVYLQKHFLPEHARKIYQMLAEGMLTEYLKRKDRVYYRMRLVG
jgi:methionyl-tRNA formyltransferase